MRPEIANQWADALEAWPHSNRCKRMLRIGDRHSPLGVLADVCIPHMSVPPMWHSNDDETYTLTPLVGNPSKTVVTKDVANFAHCRTDPSFNHGALPVSVLSRTGMSWEHIALLIRKYPDML